MNTLRIAASACGLALMAATTSAQSFQPRQGEPFPALTPAELARFEEGKVAFNTPLTDLEGVGPIFNDTSCGNCHSAPAVGGFSTRTVTRFGKMATPSAPFDPLAHLGGSLRQEQALTMFCEEVVPPEADITAERLTPITFGAGLLEGINDADILANQAAQPAGFNGFPHWVQPVEDPTGPLRISKFNWKGGTATVLNFSAGAGLNELGLTSVFFPQENAPNGDAARLLLCDNVPDPEDQPDANGRTLVDKFTDFQRFLAPPPQTPLGGMAGEQVFNTIGCAVCHTPTPYITGTVAEAALSNVALKPYSDFLVHDVGSMGDGFVEGAAQETEMMTRALWGIGSRTVMLHDGGAIGGDFEALINMAIGAHDGEALAANTAFFALGQTQRDQLIEFLLSLGRAEWDFEHDNDVDAFDWFFVEPDLTGPVPSFGPDDPGALSDVDQDGDFDLSDIAVMQRAFTGNL